MTLDASGEIQGGARYALAGANQRDIPRAQGKESVQRAAGEVRHRIA
jgi:hypothetical protein